MHKEVCPKYLHLVMMHTYLPLPYHAIPQHLVIFEFDIRLFLVFRVQCQMIWKILDRGLHHPYLKRRKSPWPHLLIISETKRFVLLFLLIYLSAPEMNILPVPDIVYGSQHFVTVTLNVCRSSVFNTIKIWKPVGHTWNRAGQWPMTGGYFMHWVDIGVTWHVAGGC